MGSKGAFYRMVLAQQLDDGSTEHKATMEDEIEGIRIGSSSVATADLQRRWTC